MVMAMLRLGRIKKMRFSCLYTILSALLGYAAAWTGVYWSSEAINTCMAEAEGMTEQFAAVFACGIVGIFSSMLVWAAVLVLGGFVLMTLTKTNEKAWFEKTDEEVAAERLSDEDETLYTEETN